MSADGQTIHCDGAGCDSTARVPVALRSQPTPGVDGWLFVTSRDGWFHYCPRCTGAYLSALAPEASVASEVS